MAFKQRWIQVKSTEGPYYDEEGNQVYKMTSLTKYRCSKCGNTTKWLLYRENYDEKCEVCESLKQNKPGNLINESNSQQGAKKFQWKTSKEEKEEALKNASAPSLEDVIKKRRNRFKLKKKGGILATS